MGSFSIIILNDMKAKDINTLENNIRKVNNVQKVISANDLIGTNIPKEIIPDEIKNKIYKENDTIMLVTFKEGISSDETLKTIETLREMTDKQCKISGMSATV